MEDELGRVLRQHSQSLTDELVAQLSSRSASRYRELDPRDLAARCRMLTEALICSAREGSEHLGEFVATIAERRFAEGFELEDLQSALRILEVNAWRIVASESPLNSLASSLAWINTTMGYARDLLARASRAHAHEAASPGRLPHLEVEKLFRGTESATSSL
jgi:hypothetical protein